MHDKVSYLVQIDHAGRTGIGECSLLPGLSPDNMSKYSDKIADIQTNPAFYLSDYTHSDLLSLELFPSLRFGLEMAFRDLNTVNSYHCFNTPFTEGRQPIQINGLIWMGDKNFMYDQLRLKLKEGWSCIKIKVGQHDFEDELEMLSFIRSQFNPNDVELRLDANGAFNYKIAAEKLKQLSAFHIHSIEQPISTGHWDQMADLCEQKIVDIALDEELIGLYDDQKKLLLNTVKPQFVILKPSLLGGWKACNQWIDLAADRGVGWWATSALESNIGLNAIAQWTATRQPQLPQGLGTGGLYVNNIESPLVVTPGYLHYDINTNWSEVNIIN